MGCNLGSALAVATMLVLTTVQRTLAADDETQQDHAMPPAPELTLEDAAASAPSLEFLEFLGQWETDDGEWIAPEDLTEENFVNLLEGALLENALKDNQP